MPSKPVLAVVAAAMLLLVPGVVRAIVVDGNCIMDQDMGENLCALTFDDGPSNYTPHLLDMLKEQGIQATFFILGANARKLPGVVRRIAAEGHEIGNHTYSHPNLHRLSYDGQKAQIAGTEAIFKEIGVTSLYMRPPYGNYDERTIQILKEHGLKLIMWSLDSHDWKRLPPDYAKLRSTRGTVYDDGSLRGVFLFHDIHKSTVDDFPRIIAHLRAGGCERFVTMSDYLKGVLDDEPCMLMTRRKTTRQVAINTDGVVGEEAPKAETPANAPTVQAAAPQKDALENLPLARCSRPFGQHEQVARIGDETMENEETKAPESVPPVAPRPVG